MSKSLLLVRIRHSVCWHDWEWREGDILTPMAQWGPSSRHLNSRAESRQRSDMIPLQIDRTRWPCRICEGAVQRRAALVC